MHRKRNFRPQPRDHRFLSELALVTLMDTAMVHQRYFPNDTTGKACQRRIRYLQNEQLIRPVEITACFGKSQATTTVHRLTMKGYAYLASRGETPPRFLKSDPKPDTLLHRLAVARSLLAFNDAAASVGLADPCWILEQDLAPGVPQEKAEVKLAERYILVEEFTLPSGEVIRCRPDMACSLTLPSKTGLGAVRLLAYWEIDRSTERHAQFLPSKLPAYFALVRSRRYLEHWSDCPEVRNTQVRVFMVFPSEDRLQNLAAKIVSNPAVVFHLPKGTKPSVDQIERSREFLESTLRLAVAKETEDPSRVLTEKTWASPFKPNPNDRRQIYRGQSSGS